MAEIKQVAKKDSRIAAYGIADLAERIWPSLEHIDSSSGTLGSAVYSVLKGCIPVLALISLSR